MPTTIKNVKAKPAGNKIATASGDVSLNTKKKAVKTSNVEILAPAKSGAKEKLRPTPNSKTEQKLKNNIHTKVVKKNDKIAPVEVLTKESGSRAKKTAAADTKMLQAQPAKGNAIVHPEKEVKVVKQTIAKKPTKTVLPADEKPKAKATAVKPAEVKKVSSKTSSKGISATDTKVKSKKTQDVVHKVETKPHTSVVAPQLAKGNSKSESKKTEISSAKKGKQTVSIRSSSTSEAAHAHRLDRHTISSRTEPVITAPRFAEPKKAPVVIARRRMENKPKSLDEPGKTMVSYHPETYRSILSDAEQTSGPVYRYSDEELNEFRDLILSRLEAARKELLYLQGLITRKDEAGTDDTENRYMNMEDGSGAMEREQLAQLASRQIQFTNHLEKALVRIENKSYGICRLTGKLIDKARLRAVPHATLSIEAKKHISSGNK